MFILDYKARKKEIPNVTIGDESIFNLWIETLSGDEVLHVIRKDGSREDYDSCGHRVQSYYDGELDVMVGGKVVLSDEELDEFNNRSCSVGYY